MLGETEVRWLELEQTLLRIEGAIALLGELVGGENGSAPANGA